MRVISSSGGIRSVLARNHSQTKFSASGWLCQTSFATSVCTWLLPAGGQTERSSKVFTSFTFPWELTRTTYKHPFYQFDINRFSTLEDLAGDPIHLGLMMISLALLLASREQRKARDLTAYATALVAAFLIFCTYLRWQPWGSRLDLPLFVLWSPVISLVLLSRRSYKIAVSAAVLLIAASTLYVFRNETRPLIGVGPDSTVLNTSRVDRLLKRHTDLRDHYLGAAHF